MAGFANPLPNDAQRDDPRYKKPLSFLQLPGQAQQQQGAPPPIVSPAQSVPQSGSQPVDPKVLNATPHQQELSRLTTGATGKSGIEQIKNPILRTLGRIGDVALSTALPSAAIFTPGTELHHRALVNQASRNVGTDEEIANNASKRGLESAQTAEQASLPEYHGAMADTAAARAENERLKAEAETSRKTAADQLHHSETKARTDAALAGHGFKTDPEGNVIPLSYEEMSEPQQAIHDLKASQAELADANKGLKQAQKDNIPKQIEMQTQRIAVAMKNADIAGQRLGLSTQQFNLKQGGAPEEQALPGQYVEDGKTVGTGFQQNVRPTTASRSAGERADPMLNLDTRIRKALQNPELAKGTGPLAGRLSEIENRVGTLPHDLSQLKNDLVSYGAFQAGLHPVRGIGALQYFDRVMGGLGQDPEELLGKLDSNKQTAQDVKKVGKGPVGSKDALPGGITLEEIDKEIQRRKGGK